MNKDYYAIHFKFYEERPERQLKRVLDYYLSISVSSSASFSGENLFGVHNSAIHSPQSCQWSHNLSCTSFINNNIHFQPVLMAQLAVEIRTLSMQKVPLGSFAKR